MPLLDRIDMCVEAHRVKYEELTTSSNEESSAVIRERVMSARRIQQDRYRNTRYRFNADLDAEAVQKYCSLTEEGRRLMSSVYESMHLTARSYNRILKTARTVADLAQSSEIRTEHLAEAVSYRAVDRRYWDHALRTA
jgi:magnesium chelatase family protein